MDPVDPLQANVTPLFDVPLHEADDRMETKGQDEYNTIYDGTNPHYCTDARSEHTDQSFYGINVRNCPCAHLPVVKWTMAWKYRYKLAIGIVVLLGIVLFMEQLLHDRYFHAFKPVKSYTEKQLAGVLPIDTATIMERMLEQQLAKGDVHECSHAFEFNIPYAHVVLSRRVDSTRLDNPTPEM